MSSIPSVQDAFPPVEVALPSVEEVHKTVRTGTNVERAEEVIQTQLGDLHVRFEALDQRLDRPPESKLLSTSIATPSVRRSSMVREGSFMTSVPVIPGTFNESEVYESCLTRELTGRDGTLSSILSSKQYEYRSEGVTEIPGARSAAAMMQDALEHGTPPPEVEQAAEFAALFLGKHSAAVFQDGYWWWFCEKFCSDAAVQRRYFDRMAHNFSRLFLSVPRRIRDRFFSWYHIALAHALYTALRLSLPTLAREFANDDFRRRLSDLLCEWTTGAILADDKDTAPCTNRTLEAFIERAETETVAGSDSQPNGTTPLSARLGDRTLSRSGSKTRRKSNNATAAARRASKAPAARPKAEALADGGDAAAKRAAAVPKLKLPLLNVRRGYAHVSQGVWDSQGTSRLLESYAQGASADLAGSKSQSGRARFMKLATGEPPAVGAPGSRFVGYPELLRRMREEVDSSAQLEKYFKLCAERDQQIGKLKKDAGTAKRMLELQKATILAGSASQFSNFLVSQLTAKASGEGITAKTHR
jgi:hypothetical protein